MKGSGNVVSRKKVVNGVARYLDVELMPHLDKKTIPGFMTTALAIGMVERMDMAIEYYKSNAIVKAFGAIDEEGNIDVEFFKEVLKKAMAEEGLPLNLAEFPLFKLFKNDQFSMTFHKSDIDKLYGYILEASDY